MSNELTTYRRNSKIIAVNIPAGYTGYTVNFSVNQNEFDDDSLVFAVTGVTVTNNIAIVNISATQNDIEERVYWYQVDLNNTPLKYTVAKSTYTVMPSLT